MENLFDLNKNMDHIPVYMPQSRVYALGPGLMGSQQKQEGSSGVRAQPGPMPKISGPMPPQVGPSSGSDRSKDDEEEQVTSPSTTYEPDYGSTNPMNPFNPDNYEWDPGKGEFVSKIQGPLDPSNWKIDDKNNIIYVGDSVWNEGNYQGTLYDPQNIFGSDLSLAFEGLESPIFENLQGGLSDMGGVADEIVGQDSGLMGGDWMGNLGKLSSAVGIAKGIYGLTQGAGGQGGVDLATGVAGYFLPAVGIIKGIFDAAMGIGEYVKAQGRQYDYYHPALNQYATDSAGNTIMNLNFYDDISDAGEQGLRPDNNWGNYDDPYGDLIGNTNWKNSNLVGIDNETGTMYWMNGDVSDYLGEQSYYDYLGANGVDVDGFARDIVGMGGGGNPMGQARDMGLMTENEWNQRLQDTFMSEIAKNGIDFSNEAFSKVNMGNFKGQLVTDVGGTGENAGRLVRIAELAGVLNNAGDGMDLSQFADYARPDDASYGHSPSKDWLDLQAMMDDPMYYGI